LQLHSRADPGTRRVHCQERAAFCSLTSQIFNFADFDQFDGFLASFFSLFGFYMFCGFCFVRMVRGQRGEGQANVPDHPFLQFPQHLAAHTAKLRQLANRAVEIAPTLDWGLATQKGLTGRLEQFMTYTLLDEGGVPLFTCHGWRRLFRLRAVVYRELALEFFATVEFDPTNRDFEDRRAFTFRRGGGGTILQHP